VQEATQDKSSENDEQQEDIFYQYITKMYGQQLIIEKEYKDVKNKFQEGHIMSADANFKQSLANRDFQKFKGCVQDYLNKKPYVF